MGGAKVLIVYFLRNYNHKELLQIVDYKYPILHKNNNVIEIWKLC